MDFLVTMYDAAGLSRAAGKTAACLNRMMEDFYNHDFQAVGGKLKELLGHTPFEVFVGAISLEIKKNRTAFKSGREKLRKLIVGEYK